MDRNADVDRGVNGRSLHDPQSLPGIVLVQRDRVAGVAGGELRALSVDGFSLLTSIFDEVLHGFGDGFALHAGDG